MMRKWEKKFQRYLDSKPKRGPVVYSEGNPANGPSLGVPFGYGKCVLWKQGEEEEYKLTLEAQDETDGLRESRSMYLPKVHKGKKTHRVDSLRRSRKDVRIKRERSQMGSKKRTMPSV
jgi:hypothetical protein